MNALKEAETLEAAGPDLLNDMGATFLNYFTRCYYSQSANDSLTIQVAT